MATGDVTDIRARLRALLPAGWFPDPDQSPILEAVLHGAATGFAWAYDLIQLAKRQTRVATAQGGFLDLISYDFFGYGLLRIAGEADSVFRVRIMREVLRERNTRHAITSTITDLTGRAPFLHEPWNPRDNGGYDVAGAYDLLSGDGVGPFGYGVDQPQMPYQIGMTIFRPTDGRIYTDAAAFAALERVRPGGITFWAQFSN